MSAVELVMAEFEIVSAAMQHQSLIGACARDAQMTQPPSPLPPLSSPQRTVRASGLN